MFFKTKRWENGSLTRLSMDADGMQIGSVSNGITLNVDGDATFNGVDPHMISPTFI